MDGGALGTVFDFDDLDSWWRDYARGRALSLVDSTTGAVVAFAEESARARLGFVRNIDLDLQSGLGEGRSGQGGVNVLGALRETTDSALLWQLRGFLGDGGSGGNAGLLYRLVPAPGVGGGALWGANVFLDYENHREHGAFWRYSVGGEVRSAWADFFANRYVAITDPRRVGDQVVYSADGYDFEARFHAPRFSWVSGGATYYTWEGDGPQGDLSGLRYGVQFAPAGMGLRVELEYDSPETGDGEFGGKINYSRKFGEAAVAEAAAAGDYNARAFLYDAARRDYSQRIRAYDITIGDWSVLEISGGELEVQAAGETAYDVRTAGFSFPVSRGGAATVILRTNRDSDSSRAVLEVSEIGARAGIETGKGGELVLVIVGQQNPRLELRSEGTLNFDGGPGSFTGRRVTAIATPSATLVLRGTAADLVRAGGTDSLTVTEGRVEVSSPDGAGALSCLPGEARGRMVGSGGVFATRCPGDGEVAGTGTAGATVVVASPSGTEAVDSGSVPFAFQTAPEGALIRVSGGAATVVVNGGADGRSGLTLALQDGSRVSLSYSADGVRSAAVLAGAAVVRTADGVGDRRVGCDASGDGLVAAYVGDLRVAVLAGVAGGGIACPDGEFAPRTVFSGTFGPVEVEAGQRGDFHQLAGLDSIQGVGHPVLEGAGAELFTISADGVLGAADPLDTPRTVHEVVVHFPAAGISDSRVGERVRGEVSVGGILSPEEVLVFAAPGYSGPAYEMSVRALTRTPLRYALESGADESISISPDGGRISAEEVSGGSEYRAGVRAQLVIGSGVFGSSESGSFRLSVLRTPELISPPVYPAEHSGEVARIVPPGAFPGMSLAVVSAGGRPGVFAISLKTDDGGGEYSALVSDRPLGNVFSTGGGGGGILVEVAGTAEGLLGTLVYGVSVRANPLSLGFLYEGRIRTETGPIFTAADAAGDVLELAVFGNPSGGAASFEVFGDSRFRMRRLSDTGAALHLTRDLSSGDRVLLTIRATRGAASGEVTAVVSWGEVPRFGGLPLRRTGAFELDGAFYTYHGRRRGLYLVEPVRRMVAADARAVCSAAGAGWRIPNFAEGIGISHDGGSAVMTLAADGDDAVIPGLNGLPHAENRVTVPLVALEDAGDVEGDVSAIGGTDAHLTDHGARFFGGASGVAGIVPGGNATRAVRSGAVFCVRPARGDGEYSAAANPLGAYFGEPPESFDVPGQVSYGGDGGGVLTLIAQLFRHNSQGETAGASDDALLLEWEGSESDLALLESSDSRRVPGGRAEVRAVLREPLVSGRSAAMTLRAGQELGYGGDSVFVLTILSGPVDRAFENLSPGETADVDDLLDANGFNPLASPVRAKFHGSRRGLDVVYSSGTARYSGLYADSLCARGGAGWRVPTLAEWAGVAADGTEIAMGADSDALLGLRRGDTVSLSAAGSDGADASALTLAVRNLAGFSSARGNMTDVNDPLFAKLPARLSVGSDGGLLAENGGDGVLVCVRVADAGYVSPSPALPAFVSVTASGATRVVSGIPDVSQNALERGTALEFPYSPVGIYTMTARSWRRDELGAIVPALDQPLTAELAGADAERFSIRQSSPGAGELEVIVDAEFSLPLPVPPSAMVVIRPVFGHPAAVRFSARIPAQVGSGTRTEVVFGGQRISYVDGIVPPRALTVENVGNVAPSAHDARDIVLQYVGVKRGLHMMISPTPHYDGYQDNLCGRGGPGWRMPNFAETAGILTPPTTVAVGVGVMSPISYRAPNARAADGDAYGLESLLVPTGDPARISLVLRAGVADGSRATGGDSTFEISPADSGASPWVFGDYFFGDRRPDLLARDGMLARLSGDFAAEGELVDGVLQSAAAVELARGLSLDNRARPVCVREAVEGYVAPDEPSAVRILPSSADYYRALGAGSEVRVATRGASFTVTAAAVRRGRFEGTEITLRDGFNRPSGVSSLPNVAMADGPSSTPLVRESVARVVSGLGTPHAVLTMLFVPKLSRDLNNAVGQGVFITVRLRRDSGAVYPTYLHDRFAGVELATLGVRATVREVRNLEAGAPSADIVMEYLGVRRGLHVMHAAKHAGNQNAVPPLAANPRGRYRDGYGENLCAAGNALGGSHWRLPDLAETFGIMAVQSESALTLISPSHPGTPDEPTPRLAFNAFEEGAHSPQYTGTVPITLRLPTHTLPAEFVSDDARAAADSLEAADAAEAVFLTEWFSEGILAGFYLGNRSAQAGWQDAALADMSGADELRAARIRPSRSREWRGGLVCVRPADPGTYGNPRETTPISVSFEAEADGRTVDVPARAAVSDAAGVTVRFYRFGRYGYEGMVPAEANPPVRIQVDEAFSAGIIESGYRAGSGSSVVFWDVGTRPDSRNYFPGGTYAVTVSTPVDGDGRGPGPDVGVFTFAATFTFRPVFGARFGTVEFAVAGESVAYPTLGTTVTYEGVIRGLDVVRSGAVAEGRQEAMCEVGAEQGWRLPTLSDLAAATEPLGLGISNVELPLFDLPGLRQRFDVDILSSDYPPRQTFTEDNLPLALSQRPGGFSGFLPLYDGDGVAPIYRRFYQPPTDVLELVGSAGRADLRPRAICVRNAARGATPGDSPYPFGAAIDVPTTRRGIAEVPTTITVSVWRHDRDGNPIGPGADDLFQIGSQLGAASPYEHSVVSSDAHFAVVAISLNPSALLSLETGQIEPGRDVFTITAGRRGGSAIRGERDTATVTVGMQLGEFGGVYIQDPDKSFTVDIGTAGSPTLATYQYLGHRRGLQVVQLDDLGGAFPRAVSGDSLADGRRACAAGGGGWRMLSLREAAGFVMDDANFAPLSGASNSEHLPGASDGENDSILMLPTNPSSPGDIGEWTAAEQLLADPAGGRGLWGLLESPSPEVPGGSLLPVHAGRDGATPVFVLNANQQRILCVRPVNPGTYVDDSNLPLPAGVMTNQATVDRFDRLDDVTVPRFNYPTEDTQPPPVTITFNAWRYHPDASALDGKATVVSAPLHWRVSGDVFGAGQTAGPVSVTISSREGAGDTGEIVAVFSITTTLRANQEVAVTLEVWASPGDTVTVVRRYTGPRFAGNIARFADQPFYDLHPAADSAVGFSFTNSAGRNVNANVHYLGLRRGLYVVRESGNNRRNTADAAALCAAGLNGWRLPSLHEGVGLYGDGNGIILRHSTAGSGRLPGFGRSGTRAVQGIPLSPTIPAVDRTLTSQSPPAWVNQNNGNFIVTHLRDFQLAIPSNPRRGTGELTITPEIGTDAGVICVLPTTDYNHRPGDEAEFPSGALFNGKRDVTTPTPPENIASIVLGYVTDADYEGARFRAGNDGVVTVSVGGYRRSGASANSILTLDSAPLVNVNVNRPPVYGTTVRTLTDGSERAFRIVETSGIVAQTVAAPDGDGGYASNMIGIRFSFVNGADIAGRTSLPDATPYWAEVTAFPEGGLPISVRIGMADFTVFAAGPADPGDPAGPGTVPYDDGSGTTHNLSPGDTAPAMGVESTLGAANVDISIVYPGVRRGLHVLHSAVPVADGYADDLCASAGNNWRLPTLPEYVGALTDAEVAVALPPDADVAGIAAGTRLALGAHLNHPHATGPVRVAAGYAGIYAGPGFDTPAGFRYLSPVVRVNERGDFHLSDAQGREAVAVCVREIDSAECDPACPAYAAPRDPVVGVRFLFNHDGTDFQVQSPERNFAEFGPILHPFPVLTMTARAFRYTRSAISEQVNDDPALGTVAIPVSVEADGVLGIETESRSGPTELVLTLALADPSALYRGDVAGRVRAYALVDGAATDAASVFEMRFGRTLRPAAFGGIPILNGGRAHTSDSPLEVVNPSGGQVRVRFYRRRGLDVLVGDSAGVSDPIALCESGGEGWRVPNLAELGMLSDVDSLGVKAADTFAYRIASTSFADYDGLEGAPINAGHPFAVQPWADGEWRESVGELSGADALSRNIGPAYAPVGHNPDGTGTRVVCVRARDGGSYIEPPDPVLIRYSSGGQSTLAGRMDESDKNIGELVVTVSPVAGESFLVTAEAVRRGRSSGFVVDGDENFDYLGEQGGGNFLSADAPAVAEDGRMVIRVTVASAFSSAVDPYMLSVRPPAHDGDGIALSVRVVPGNVVRFAGVPLEVSDPFAATSFSLERVAGIFSPGAFSDVGMRYEGIWRGLHVVASEGNVADGMQDEICLRGGADWRVPTFPEMRGLALAGSATLSEVSGFAGGNNVESGLPGVGDQTFGLTVSLAATTSVDTGRPSGFSAGGRFFADLYFKMERAGTPGFHSAYVPGVNSAGNRDDARARAVCVRAASPAAYDYDSRVGRLALRIPTGDAGALSYCAPSATCAGAGSLGNISSPDNGVYSAVVSQSPEVSGGLLTVEAALVRTGRTGPVTVEAAGLSASVADSATGLLVSLSESATLTLDYEVAAEDEAGADGWRRVVVSHPALDDVPASAEAVLSSRESGRAVRLVAGITGPEHAVFAGQTLRIAVEDPTALALPAGSYVTVASGAGDLRMAFLGRRRGLYYVVSGSGTDEDFAAAVWPQEVACDAGGEGWRVPTFAEAAGMFWNGATLSVGGTGLSADNGSNAEDRAFAIYTGLRLNLGPLRPGDRSAALDPRSVDGVFISEFRVVPGDVNRTRALDPRNNSVTGELTSIAAGDASLGSRHVMCVRAAPVTARDPVPFSETDTVVPVLHMVPILNSDQTSGCTAINSVTTVLCGQPQAGFNILNDGTTLSAVWRVNRGSSSQWWDADEATGVVTDYLAAEVGRLPLRRDGTRPGLLTLTVKARRIGRSGDLESVVPLDVSWGVSGVEIERLASSKPDEIEFEVRHPERARNSRSASAVITVKSASGLVRVFDLSLRVFDVLPKFGVSVLTGDGVVASGSGDSRLSVQAVPANVPLPGGLRTHFGRPDNDTRGGAVDAWHYYGERRGLHWMFRSRSATEVVPEAYAAGVLTDSVGWVAVDCRSRDATSETTTWRRPTWTEVMGLLQSGDEGAIGPEIDGVLGSDPQSPDDSTQVADLPLLVPGLQFRLPAALSADDIATPEFPDPFAGIQTDLWGIAAGIRFRVSDNSVLTRLPDPAYGACVLEADADYAEPANPGFLEFGSVHGESLIETEVSAPPGQTVALEAVLQLRTRHGSFGAVPNLDRTDYAYAAEVSLNPPVSGYVAEIAESGDGFDFGTSGQNFYGHRVVVRRTSPGTGPAALNVVARAMGTEATLRVNVVPAGPVFHGQTLSAGTPFAVLDVVNDEDSISATVDFGMEYLGVRRGLHIAAMTGKRSASDLSGRPRGYEDSLCGEGNPSRVLRVDTAVNTDSPWRVPTVVEMAGLFGDGETGVFTVPRYPDVVFAGAGGIGTGGQTVRLTPAGAGDIAALSDYDAGGGSFPYRDSAVFVRLYNGAAGPASGANDSRNRLLSLSPDGAIDDRDSALYVCVRPAPGWRAPAEPVDWAVDVLSYSPPFYPDAGDPQAGPQSYRLFGAVSRFEDFGEVALHRNVSGRRLSVNMDRPSFAEPYAESRIRTTLAFAFLTVNITPLTVRRVLPFTRFGGLDTNLLSRLPGTESATRTQVMRGMVLADGSPSAASVFVQADGAEVLYADIRKLQNPETPVSLALVAEMGGAMDLVVTLTIENTYAGYASSVLFAGRTMAVGDSEVFEDVSGTLSGQADLDVTMYYHGLHNGWNVVYSTTPFPDGYQDAVCDAGRNVLVRNDRWEIPSSSAVLGLTSPVGRGTVPLAYPPGVFDLGGTTPITIETSIQDGRYYRPPGHGPLPLAVSETDGIWSAIYSSRDADGDAASPPYRAVDLFGDGAMKRIVCVAGNTESVTAESPSNYEVVAAQLHTTDDAIGGTPLVTLNPAAGTGKPTVVATFREAPVGTPLFTLGFSANVVERDGIGVAGLYHAANWFEYSSGNRLSVGSAVSGGSPQVFFNHDETIAREGGVILITARLRPERHAGSEGVPVLGLEVVLEVRVRQSEAGYTGVDENGQPFPAVFAPLGVYAFKDVESAIPGRADLASAPMTYSGVHRGLHWATAGGTPVRDGYQENLCLKMGSGWRVPGVAELAGYWAPEDAVSVPIKYGHDAMATLSGTMTITVPEREVITDEGGGVMSTMTIAAFDIDVGKLTVAHTISHETAARDALSGSGVTVGFEPRGSSDDAAPSTNDSFKVWVDFYYDYAGKTPSQSDYGGGFDYGGRNPAAFARWRNGTLEIAPGFYHFTDNTQEGLMACVRPARSDYVRPADPVNVRFETSSGQTSGRPYASDRGGADSAAVGGETRAHPSFAEILAMSYDADLGGGVVTVRLVRPSRTSGFGATGGAGTRALSDDDDGVLGIVFSSVLTEGWELYYRREGDAYRLLVRESPAPTGSRQYFVAAFPRLGDAEFVRLDMTWPAASLSRGASGAEGRPTAEELEEMGFRRAGE